MKNYARRYGPRYFGLYDAVIKWCERNGDVFAKRAFDRRTLNCEPARLGIAPEHRSKILFAPQYPLSQLQRLHLIN